MATADDKRTRTLVLAMVAAIAFFMEALDSTIVVTAIPKMAVGLKTDPVSLTLGVTIYLLALAVVIPSSGWIADRIGAKIGFAGGITLFTLASVLCGLAQHLPDFLLARGVQGIGAALMSPIGRLALLRQTDKRDLVQTMNWVAFPGLLGPVLGPPLGGLFASYLSWRWIFFVNVPFGLIGLIAVLKVVPGDRMPEKRPFDSLGFVLNGASLAILLFGLERLSIRGALASSLVVITLALALLCGAIWHARVKTYPLVSLNAVRIKTIVAATLTGGWLFRMAMTAPTFVLPLFLQLGLGLSPAAAGALILAHTSGDITAKLFTRQALKALGFRISLAAGAILFALGLCACAAFTPQTPAVLIIAILFAAGIVRSLVMTAVTSLQFADMPEALLNSASTLGSAITPVVTTVGITCASLGLSLLTPANAQPGMSQFSNVLCATAALSLASAVIFFRLPANAGAAARG